MAFGDGFKAMAFEVKLNWSFWRWIESNMLGKRHWKEIQCHYLASALCSPLAQFINIHDLKVFLYILSPFHLLSISEYIIPHTSDFLE